MTKTILFYHDLASPNAYFANKVLKQIAERTGAQITYRPVLLGGVFKATGNQAPFVAFGNIPAKMKYMQIEMNRFVKQHGLTKFKMNPHFPLNTLVLSRAAVAADMNGELEAFITAGEQLVWEDGLKMDDPEVFVDKFTALGLNGEKLLAQTQDPDVKAKLVANTNEAVDCGVFGVPSFIVDDELYFGKDTLHEIENVLGLRTR